MTYRVEPWSDSIDMTEFYQLAKDRGYLNNSSKEMLIDCFDNEKEKQLWILFYNDRVVGTMVAHSFDDVMGPGSYRTCVRSCVLYDLLDKSKASLKTADWYKRLRDPTSQLMMPESFKWAPTGSKFYISSNDSTVASQHKINTVAMRILSSVGIVTRVKDVVYRGTSQTIWQINLDVWWNALDRDYKWS